MLDYKRNDMNYCKDCRYFLWPTILREHPVCAKSPGLEIDTRQEMTDPVSGEKLYGSATVARYSDSLCGIEGKWFEASQ